MTEEPTRPDTPEVDATQQRAALEPLITRRARPRSATPPVEGPLSPEDDIFGTPHNPNEPIDPNDYVKLPRRGRSWLRVSIVLGVVAVAFIATFLVFNGWVDGQVNPSGGPGEPVEFAVEDGWSTNRVAEELAGANVISNSTIFRYWLRCPSLAKPTLGCDETIDVNFQTGDYDLNTHMAFEDVLTVLEEGPAPIVVLKVRIPEGLRLGELKTRLVEQNPLFKIQDIDAALASGNIVSSFDPPKRDGADFMEGLFFPAVYELSEDDATDELKLMIQMSKTMENRFAGVQADVEEQFGRASEIDELGLTDYEIITIASMIEEEAKVDGDRPKISRVIYNRLLAGEPLGVDATARYAGFDPADNEFDSPYNTRLYAGLPPTAIAAPGALSLEAAMHPEDGDWFYYVLTNEGGVDGAHRFVDTSDEFEVARQVCIELDLGCG
ncbi:MAG: endolytic transglycosylase MltG [Acidobacteria bacterium]|nr:endolytic transglycosylase MltG [Acidobacteriota bacterium]